MRLDSLLYVFLQTDFFVNDGGFLPSALSDVRVYVAFSVLVLIFVVVIINRYQTILKLLKEKNDAMKVIKRQNNALKQREASITDSLIYAQRIQEARLPSEEYFRTHFSSSFILYKPRDIVSGDFYWIGEKDGWIYVVAADCTGHGVSGALMSMIGMDIIEKTINEHHITVPSAILTNLNENLEKIFNREKNLGETIVDGMDIGLCAINKREKRLLYSGAFFHMYLCRDGSLKQIRGNKIVIGMNSSKTPFTDNEVEIEEDDILYLCSDGYIDQFGGSDNKKFMARRLRYLLLNIHKFEAKDQKAILEENFKTWMGINPQVDDMMVIGLKPF